MREAGRGPAGGFILAGGGSTRMGRDKALLEYDGKTLLEFVAAAVRSATGNVIIVADPARYRTFGFPVVPDERPGCGPLGGIVTALSVSDYDWNLIAACDMPGIDSPFLEMLIREARGAPPGTRCVVPVGPGGPEPLCALYHREALPTMRQALGRNILKMRRVLAELESLPVTVADAARFRNINTPEDWTGR
jgi:molybdopterin-guanine dinucleotide biosynthesis protein A